MIRKRSLLLVLVILTILLTAPVAHARLTARTSLVTNSIGASKLVLRLASTTPVTASAKPTRVTVVGGGNSYPLERVRSVAMTSTKLGTWKSKAYAGQDQKALFDLIGKQVTVKVRSLSGVNSFGSTLVSTDTMGQAAIDQMTGVIDGAAFGDYSSSGSERYELHLCTDGVMRYFHSFNSEFGSVTTEKFGEPWSVKQALINSKETYARVLLEVTFTVRNDSGEGLSETNEPFQTLIEFSQGTWYWAGDVAETFAATCEPTF